MFDASIHTSPLPHPGYILFSSHWDAEALSFCCCSCSVAKSCSTLCDPMGCSMPGSSVLHCKLSWSLLKFMPIASVMLSNHLSHPLPLLPPSAFNLSHHQSFLMSRLFASSGQSIRDSASVLPTNIQGWFPLELT